MIEKLKGLASGLKNPLCALGYHDYRDTGPFWGTKVGKEQVECIRCKDRKIRDKTPASS